MTAAQYLTGLALLAVVAGCVARIAFVLRRLILPAWSHAPARLAEVVIGITTLVVVSEVLGTIDMFRRWPLVLTLVAAAAATFLGPHRRSSSPLTAGEPPLVGREVREAQHGSSRALSGGTLAVICLMLIPWFYTTLNVVHHGIREFDSLTYHLPFAARFVQDASLTGIQFIGNPPVSFYPMNSELVHAVGMLLMRRDLLSVVMNFAWLGLTLLAAWCIGRPNGVKLQTTAAAAFVASIQLIAFSQGGTAKNDIAALALLLTALGIWANSDESSAVLALVALAGGLAIGTRLNYWAPVLALAFATSLRRPRGQRRTAGAWWLVGIFVGGGFWYLRNLARVGNPFPWIGVKLAGVVNLPSTSGPVDCGTRSVAHYATNPSFVSAHLVPQLSPFLGRLWPVLLVLMLAGIGLGLAARAGSTEQTVAFVALVTGMVYLFTPATAGGFEGSCFGFNLRFLAPALMLGILVLPLWLGRRGRHSGAVLICAGVGVLFDAHIPVTAAPILGAACVAALGCALIAAPRHYFTRRAIVLATMIAGAVIVAGGWELQRVYFRNRYVQPRLQQPVDAVYAALPHKTHMRIAVDGFSETFPLYGVDLTNYVVLPAEQHGARFNSYQSCAPWIAALERGRFTYVVTAEQGSRLPPTASWTRRYPGSSEVRASPRGLIRAGKPWQWEIFALPRPATLNPTTACASRANVHP